MHILACLKGHVGLGARPLVVIAGILCVVSVAGNDDLLRCTVNADCPTGGFCFKDECARCLCPEGFLVINLFTDTKLTKVCQKSPTREIPRVFQECSRGPGRRGQCPYGSRCDEKSRTCTCRRGLRPHRDNTRCRLGVYYESCSRRLKCDPDLGLECRGRPGRCRCTASHHRPSKWTRHVLSRWDYSKVQGEPQECVTRAVGEPCRSDGECTAVAGSGALCGLCGFCECRVPGHVPDVVGTTCGPGMGLGQACSLNSHFVCDGTRGLQCGDVCDLYSYDYQPKTCSCSQMHDRVGAGCIAKQVGSACYTDLDCYPVRDGFGYCEGGRCKANIASSPPDYIPFLASRDCHIRRPLSTLSPIGDKGKYERGKNATRPHRHEELAAAEADTYHDDDGGKLPVRFENITGWLSLQATTPPQNSHLNGVRQLSSSPSSSSSSSSPTSSFSHSQTTRLLLWWLSLTLTVLQLTSR